LNLLIFEINEPAVSAQHTVD